LAQIDGAGVDWDGRHHRGRRCDAGYRGENGMARPRLLEVGAGCGPGVGYRTDQDRHRQHVFLSPDAGRRAIGSAARAASADARNTRRTSGTSAADAAAGDFHTGAAGARPSQAGCEPARELAQPPGPRKRRSLRPATLRREDPCARAIRSESLVQELFAPLRRLSR